jgi:hypothetical protein
MFGGMLDPEMIEDTAKIAKEAISDKFESTSLSTIETTATPPGLLKRTSNGLVWRDNKDYFNLDIQETTDVEAPSYSNLLFLLTFHTFNYIFPIRKRGERPHLLRNANSFFLAF